MDETCLARTPHPPHIQHIITNGQVEHIILNGQCVLPKPHAEHQNYYGERWPDEKKA